MPFKRLTCAVVTVRIYSVVRPYIFRWRSRLVTVQCSATPNWWLQHGVSLKAKLKQLQGTRIESQAICRVTGVYVRFVNPQSWKGKFPELATEIPTHTPLQATVLSNTCRKASERKPVHTAGDYPKKRLSDPPFQLDLVLSPSKVLSGYLDIHTACRPRDLCAILLTSCSLPSNLPLKPIRWSARDEQRRKVVRTPCLGMQCRSIKRQREGVVLPARSVPGIARPANTVVQRRMNSPSGMGQHSPQGQDSGQTASEEDTAAEARVLYLNDAVTQF